MNALVSYFVDVGSTIIKGVRVNGAGAPVNAFLKRTPGGAIPEEVDKVLTELGCDRKTSADIRICSSANGGLSVGLLSLSRKASGAVALRILEAVGANVRFHHIWREAAMQDATPHVDVLVLSGGLDSFSAKSVQDGISSLSLDPYRFDRLVYAGHATASEAVKRRWPQAEIVTNPLDISLVSTDHSLGSYARQTYLDDIESKKDLQPLRPLSRVPIEPTPSVVSKAFARLQSRIPSPSIMLDIGGATTDLHFTKEVLDDSNMTAGEIATFPAIARHVFTAFGVHDSKVSTMKALAADPLGVDLLAALYGGEHRATHQQLTEGIAPDRLLFCACIFLALRACLEGREEAPRINVGAMASLMITGGAAKCLDTDDVARTLKAATGWSPRAGIMRDRDYRWWVLGLMESEGIAETTWSAIDG